jgi:hypothetical protein
MRAGDFSGLGAIRDPLTGAPFDGNRIPASRISPESQRIQDRFYPMPNFGNTAVFTALNHRILFDATGQYEHYDVRIDQKIGARNTLYARLGWQQFPVIQGGNSAYHGFQVEARRRLQAFSFDLGYTWSNTISDAPDLGDEVAPSLENPFDRRAWRGREEYALQHRFTGTAFWPIPVGKGRRFLGDASGLVNGVLGGWETTWTLFLQSGSWFHPTFTGRDISNTGVLTGRPDRLSDGALSDPTPRSLVRRRRVCSAAGQRRALREYRAQHP